MARLHLDLRGEICPYTFLRAKLALEEIAQGEELVIVLDHAPAFETVPRALAEEGHEVLGIDCPAPRGPCTLRVRKHESEGRGAHGRTFR